MSYLELIWSLIISWAILEFNFRYRKKIDNWKKRPSYFTSNCDSVDWSTFESQTWTAKFSSRAWTTHCSRLGLIYSSSYKQFKRMFFFSTKSSLRTCKNTKKLKPVLFLDFKITHMGTNFFPFYHPFFQAFVVQHKRANLWLQLF